MAPSKCEIKKHWLFVYGTLKWGFQNHDLLCGVEPEGNGLGVIWNAKLFQCYKLPVAIEVNDENYQILGELYRVDDHILRNLDLLEGHPNLYYRKKVEVGYNDFHGITTVKAWCYFGRIEQFDYLVAVPDGYYE